MLFRSVETNAYQPVHGHELLRHDIRWSIDAGKTWRQVEEPEDGLRIHTGAPEGTTVMVQARITTEAGTGGWSPTLRLKRRGKVNTYGEITLGDG